MNTVKVKALVQSVESKKQWEETYEMPVGADPKQFCKQIIEDWNGEELRRKKERPKDYWVDIRKFIRVVKTSKTVIKYCHMVKKNLHRKYGTMNRIFDVMVCTKCGYKKRRYGLSESGLDRRCHPERTCKTCGIELKTIEGFEAHVKKVHEGKIPTENAI